MKKIIKKYKSHGDGSFKLKNFDQLGENVIFEKGVLVFHPENITIGNNVYIGHNTILKGYYKNKMVIGNNTWIGQGCFFHSAGGITIGNTVGIGPMVKILSSMHKDIDCKNAVMENDLDFESVEIEDGVDIGIGTIILPGIKISKGAIIGAGSVVTKDVPEFAIHAGIPAKFLRFRK